MPNLVPVKKSNDDLPFPDNSAELERIQKRLDYQYWLNVYKLFKDMPPIFLEPSENFKEKESTHYSQQNSLDKDG